MATGRLAAIDITNAATDTQLYACPNNKTASFSVCITNRTSSAIQVRLALTSSNSIANGEYVAYDVTVYGNEVYERSGFVIGQGQYVYVRSSSNAGVNAVVYGYEE